jgi:hypothetical protein
VPWQWLVFGVIVAALVLAVGHYMTFGGTSTVSSSVSTTYTGKVTRTDLLGQTVCITYPQETSKTGFCGPMYHSGNFGPRVGDHVQFQIWNLVRGPSSLKIAEVLPN